MSFDTCSEVNDLCPVEATILGYYPSMGASIFFAIAFGLCTVAATGLSIWKKTWTFGIALFIGLFLETGGYIGRALLHKNPWDSGAFQLQICAIVLAPTFICISIYLTLKHVALALNPSLSRIQPKWYPRIFLPADVSCLLLQGIGGGVAAAAGPTQRTLVNAGNNLIIAGIALQVVVLGAFGVAAVDYWLRVKKTFANGEASGASLALWRDGKFRKFGYAVVVAYVSILVRCVYRIAEMAGGWGNHIMQDEISFMILDATLVLITVYCLTLFHPGLYFPQMSNGYRRAEAKEAKNNTSPGTESANEAPVVAEGEKRV